MDGDGMILYVLLCGLCFGVGTFVSILFIIFEKDPDPPQQKPKEELKEEIRQEIKQMSIPDFIEWIKR